MTLCFIDQTTPVGIVTLDQFDNHLVLILNFVVIQDLFQTKEELTLELLLLLLLDSEVNDRATGVQRFNDLVLEVAGEDESAVVVELLYGGSKGQLHVSSGVVCLIDDDHLVGCSRGQ